MEPATALEPPTTRAQDRPSQRFWQLWSANSASNLGDGLYQFILPVLAVQLTTRPSLVAGVNVMLTLAWLLFALHAGSLVDRLDRRRLLLLVNLNRIVLLLALSIAVAFGQASIALLYGMALLLGIGETLADTALIALIPAVVPGERLERANAYLTGTQTVTNTFLGPPLAGYLAGLGVVWVTGLGAIMYAVASTALLLMRGRYRSAPAPIADGPTAPQGHVTEGLRFLWGHPLLRALTLFTAAMNVWWSSWTALFILYALTPGPMQLASLQYGLLLTAMAVGSLLGSVLCQRVRQLVGIRAALALDLLGTVALVGAPVLTTHALAIGGAMALAGFGASIWVILVTTLRHRMVPPELQGRVYSASRMISWGIGPLSAVLAGLAADRWGIRAVFAVGAVAGVVLLALFFALVRSSALQSVLATPAAEPAQV